MTANQLETDHFSVSRFSEFSFEQQKIAPPWIDRAEFSKYAKFYKNPF